MSNNITFAKIFKQSVLAGLISSLILTMLADWLTDISNDKLIVIFTGSLIICALLYMSVMIEKKRKLEEADQAAKKRLADALKANERPRRDC